VVPLAPSRCPPSPPLAFDYTFQAQAGDINTNLDTFAEDRRNLSAPNNSAQDDFLKGLSLCVGRVRRSRLHAPVHNRPRQVSLEMEPSEDLLDSLPSRRQIPSSQLQIGLLQPAAARYNLRAGPCEQCNAGGTRQTFLFSLLAPWLILSCSSRRYTSWAWKSVMTRGMPSRWLHP
jgi:hypothetical protein